MPRILIPQKTLKKKKIPKEHLTFTHNPLPFKYHEYDKQDSKQHKMIKYLEELRDKQFRKVGCDPGIINIMNFQEILVGKDGKNYYEKSKSMKYSR